jgi:co-chaperonin GroES (HSP10)
MSTHNPDSVPVDNRPECRPILLCAEPTDSAELNFLPEHEWILVDPVDAEFRPTGVARRSPPSGRVVALGPGCIRPDGRVVGPAYGIGTLIFYLDAMEIVLNGHDYLLVEYADILGHIPSVE